ncbi:MAG: DUF2785 domain-containing protein [Nocardioidaceae bacterium]
MESAFWDRVVAEGHKVPRDPQDPPLADLTAELTAMLGDPDPYRRDEVAYPTLATWVEDGVYDQLLEGLGDGMTEGLLVGLGEADTDTVFRRSFSVLVLAECIVRDQSEHLLTPETTLRWGDRLAGWLVRERDLRGFVPGKGWAHAVAHGADAVLALALSDGIGRLELTVLLDVVADRLLVATEHRFVHGEHDRLARATLGILRRDLVDMSVLEPWLARLATAAAQGERPVDGPADVVADNVDSYLRALHLQVALAPNPPVCRADLLLALIDRLREVHPGLLGSLATGR